MSDNNQLSFTDLMNRAFDEPSGTLRVTEVAGATGKGTPTVTAVAPSSSVPTLLIAANANRKEVLFYNNGSQTVYIYPGNTFTSSDGMPVLANSAFVDDKTLGAWYGLAATGTGDVRVIEVE